MASIKHDIKNFDEKKFLTELANVKLHLMYVTNLFDETAKFYLAREWKVHGKPFRTTWSTGWYINYLKYTQKFRTGKSTLVLKMEQKKTTVFICRSGDKIVQALPEAAAKYGDQMKSLSDYFREDKEKELIGSIRQICKIVAPDRILAELDPVYFTEELSSTLPNLVRRKLHVFSEWNIQHNVPPAERKGEKK